MIKLRTLNHFESNSKFIYLQVRLYDRLFKHKNPEDSSEVPGGFLSDINPNTLTVKKAKADKHIAEAKVTNHSWSNIIIELGSM